MTGQPIHPTDRDREVARELLHALGLSWPIETELNVAAIIATARAEERRRIVAELIEGRGSHDCPACGDTGALPYGSSVCPLCEGYGKL